MRARVLPQPPARTGPAHRWLAPVAALLALWGVALSVPPWRALIEQGMAWHMLVQMPLLVAAGACAAAAWPQALGGRWAAWNRYGLTGFMLAQGITAYARDLPFQSARVHAEKLAGKLLDRFNKAVA